MKPLAILAVIAACALPQAAFLQERTIEEIVVTATKREASIQDIPIAISAFTGEDLSTRGITEVYDLQQVAPSLFVNHSNSTTNGGTLRIRGVGTTGNNVGLEASVGFFVDGIYRSRSGHALNDLVDVRRVEVLRGPQGTLFGKNTSAGAVRVISNRPEFEPSGSLSLSGGSLDTVRGDGAYTAPISDTAAFRIAGNFHKRDGYYEDIDTGDKYSKIDRYALKGQLLFQPDEDVDIRVILDYTNRDETCCPATYHYLGVTAPILRALGGNPVVSKDGDVGVNAPPFEEMEDYGATIEVSWDLGFADLQSITGIREFQVERGQDVDFSNVDIYLQGNTDEQFDIFSQEVHLVGGSDNFDWLVGGIFGTEDITAKGRFLEIAGQGPAYFDLLLAGGGGALTRLLSPGQGLRGAFKQDSSFFAFFTHNTWRMTEKFALTFGLRYSDEEKDGDSVINDTGGADTVAENWPCAALPIPTFCQNAGYSLSRSEDKITGTVKIAYQVAQDASVYGGFARGYKAGGFNLDPTSYKLDAAGNVVTDSREFVAEVMDSWEVGLKGLWAGGRVTTNFAAFSARIEDFQLNTFEGAFFTVNNVPKVKSKGLELEYAWQLTDGVLLGGGVALINTRYGGTAGSEVNKPELDGMRITNAPKWQLSSSLLVERPLPMLGNFNWTLNLNWFHRSTHNTGSDLGPRKFQGAYSLWNGQLGIRRQDGAFEAFLWSTNLADERYKTVIFNSVSQADSRSTFVGAPRVWGLGFRTSF